MPARNQYHDAVRDALVADGWTITDDPFRLTFGGRELYVDLGAERLTIGATKDEVRIAVEVQSFLNPSQVRDLHEAVGQYVVYRSILEDSDPDRALYLAVPRRVEAGILGEPLGRLVIEKTSLRVLVFDDVKRKVVKWIK